jgi:CheY-like chemotaxis protein
MEVNSSIERYRIVLAEDNPADVYLIRHALTTAGISFDLTVFEDGAEALRYLRHEDEHNQAPRPDLVLLDLNLPKRPGTDILAAIRSADDMSGVPVAILTSSSSPMDRAKTEQLNANCYIQKPLDLDDFLKIGNVIKDLLASRRQPC